LDSPTKDESVINPKTTGQLGLAVPSAPLAFADEAAEQLCNFLRCASLLPAYRANSRCRLICWLSVNSGRRQAAARQIVGFKVYVCGLAAPVAALVAP